MSKVSGRHSRLLADLESSESDVEIAKPESKNKKNDETKFLFDESDSDTEKTLSVNRKYADKFDDVKRRQELQHLTDKYRNEHVNDTDSEDSGSSISDSDASKLDTNEKDDMFAEVFMRLRQNDPSVKDRDAPFFHGISELSVKTTDKPFTLKDEYQRAIESKGENDVTDLNAPTGRGLKPTTLKERAALSSFRDATDIIDTSSELLQKKTSTSTTSDPVSKKKLKSAFGDVADNQEAFLRDFFVGEKWKESDDDSSDEHGDEWVSKSQNRKGMRKGKIDWEQLAREDEDDMFYEDAEQWERDFQEKQFHHEMVDDSDELQVQSFPRRATTLADRAEGTGGDGLLRKVESSRKEQRRRKLERLREQQLQRTEELKRLKTLKRSEIDKKRMLIASVAGIGDDDTDKMSNAKLLSKLKSIWSSEELERDFDPAEFDKQMSSLFGNDYDDDMDDDEFENMKNELGDESDSDSQDSLLEGLAPTPQVGADVDDDITAMLYPSQVVSKMEVESSKRIEKKSKKASEVLSTLSSELDKTVDDYYKLHYEKVLTGGLKTRYKYRTVDSEDFGLTAEDILSRDDRTLNMIAPMKCYASYSTVKENARDRAKSMNRLQNMRLLNPNRRSRKYGDVSKTVLFDPSIPEEEGEAIAEKVRVATEKLKHDADETKRSRDDVEDGRTKKKMTRKE